MQAGGPIGAEDLGKRRESSCRGSSSSSNRMASKGNREYRCE